MTERQPNTQEALPDMELHNFIERMTPQERQEYKERYLAEISDRETIVHMINSMETTTQDKLF